MTWHRIFGALPAAPDPEALVRHLRAAGIDGTPHVEGDEHGWFRVVLDAPPFASPLTLERYLSSEEGVRDELNTWAAWVEADGDSPTHVQLMQHLISTTQIITMECGEGAPLHDRISQFLAQETAGIWQADGRGFFTADGALLLPEER